MKINRNMCYKAIACELGVLLLFEHFLPFRESDIKLSFIKGDLFVEMGNNIFLMTPNLIDCLLKAPRLFICSGETFLYETKKMEKGIEVNADLLAQLKGAMAVLVGR